MQDLHERPEIRSRETIAFEALDKVDESIVLAKALLSVGLTSPAIQGLVQAREIIKEARKVKGEK